MKRFQRNMQDFASNVVIGGIGGGLFGLTVARFGDFEPIAASFNAALVGTTWASLFSFAQQNPLNSLPWPTLPGRPIKIGGQQSFLTSLIPFDTPHKPDYTNGKPIASLSWRVRVEYEGIYTTHTISDWEAEDFIRSAWHRQRNAKSPFSRTYWTQTRSPKLERVRYEAFITFLTQRGLIVDRSSGRSGRLTLSPGLAMHYLRGGQ